MRAVAIVQARMGSTRLPGKVLMQLAGRSVLERVIRRLRRSSKLSTIVVATTTSPNDDCIVTECERLGVKSYRGSEPDVLDRYYRAVEATEADVVVRVTSDCPLIDAEVLDETIAEFESTRADYVSNCVPRTFPRGLDAEVIARSALAQAWQEAGNPYQREHVTPYIYEHPELFKLCFHRTTVDYSRYRWTLDTAEDFELLNEVCSYFGADDSFGWREVLALMELRPELAELNSNVLQKPLVAS